MTVSVFILNNFEPRENIQDESERTHQTPGMYCIHENNVKKLTCSSSIFICSQIIQSVALKTVRTIALLI